MSLPLLLECFCFFLMTCNYFILLYFYTTQIKNNLPFYVNFLVTFFMTCNFLCTFFVTFVLHYTILNIKRKTFTMLRDFLGLCMTLLET